MIAIEYGVVGLHGKLRLHCHRGIFLGGIDPRDAFATGKRVTPAGLPRERPVHGICPAASVAALLLGETVDGAYIIGRAGNGSAGRAQSIVHRGALREHDRGAIREASQAIALRARAIDADVNGNRAGRRRRGGFGFGFGLLICRRRTRGRGRARVFGCIRRCRTGCPRPPRKRRPIEKPARTKNPPIAPATNLLTSSRPLLSRLPRRMPCPHHPGNCRADRT